MHYFLILVLQFKFKITLVKGMLRLFLLHFIEFDDDVNYITGFTALYVSLGCHILLVINHMVLGMDVIIQL